MDERIEELIQTRGWNELTPDEKKLIGELIGTEEQYEAMRKVTLGLSAVPKSDLDPSPAVLKSLRQTLRRQKGTSGFLAPVFSFRIPAYAVVLLLTAGVFITWRFQQPHGPIQVSTNAIVTTDTVYIERPPDTVYVRQVVYRYVNPPVEKQKIFSVVREMDPGTVGVNMKEKEELENLLVSGSY
jgi:hypothetical protein